MNKKQDNQNLLWKYAGLGTQLLVGLGICVWLGHRADTWLELSMPLGVWLLPLLFIAVILYRIIRDTSAK